MKTRDLLIFGGIGLALWYVLGKTHAIATLVYVPRGISFSGGAMQITVGVQNPTSTAITLRSLVGTIYLNGDAIGNVSDFFATQINPNAETPIQLSVVPNLFGVAQLAAGIIQNGMAAANFSFHGFANVDNNTFPVDFNLSAIPT